MNLPHLRYFVELAHTQHYTRAAERLCITQPSLSHAMAQLEMELGVPLFEKDGRNISLTRFGQQFLICAQQTLSTLDEGVEELQRVARGEGVIRLGLLRTLGIDLVPSLAAKFLASKPGKFCSRPPANLGFAAIPISRQDLVLIVPRNHPLSSVHAVDLAETLPYPQVFFSKNSGLRGVVHGLFAQIGGTPQIAYETEEDQVIAGLVAQGFGIAVVPYMEMLLRLDVKIIQISHPAWERNFYLVSDDRAYQTPAVRQFRQFILDGACL